MALQDRPITPYQQSSVGGWVGNYRNTDGKDHVSLLSFVIIAPPPSDTGSALDGRVLVQPETIGRYNRIIMYTYKFVLHYRINGQPYFIANIRIDCFSFYQTTFNFFSIDHRLTYIFDFRFYKINTKKFLTTKNTHITRMPQTKKRRTFNSSLNNLLWVFLLR